MDHRGDRSGRTGSGAGMKDGPRALGLGQRPNHLGGARPEAPGPRPVRIAVLVSGHGTNLQSILDACARGEISGRVVVVASTTATAYAPVRARQAGRPAGRVAPPAVSPSA